MGSNRNQTILLNVHNLGMSVRLDSFVREQFPFWGRRAVRSLINAGNVQVNGRKAWLCSFLVENGDRIAISHPPEEKQCLPLSFEESWIISQDEEIIAVNKPAGLLSHASHGIHKDNLLDLARAHFGQLSLFHRLDRDTSGVVLLTRSSSINRSLDRAFKNGTVKKEYLAVVVVPNDLNGEGVITAPIGGHPCRHDMMAVMESGGQRAITRYKIIAEDDTKQWVHLWPETGRTHQLRVHLASMGAHILGDRLYTAPFHKEYRIHRPQMGRMMLHALHISLPEMERFSSRSYTAPLPEDFINLCH